jgi:hypothetical protein
MCGDDVAVQKGFEGASPPPGVTNSRGGVEGGQFEIPTGGHTLLLPALNMCRPLTTRLHRYKQYDIRWHMSTLQATRYTLISSLTAFITCM